jgi:hypothetical protein
MTKIIALITSLIITFNVASAPVASAAQPTATPAPVVQARKPITTPARPVQPTPTPHSQAPTAQTKFIPLILPALPYLAALITAGLSAAAMITITIVRPIDISVELKKKYNGNRPDKIVYRLGNGSNKNLTPRDVQVDGIAKDIDGLSYMDKPPAINTDGYTAIDCNVVNATLELLCIQDPKNKSHYLIRAINPVKNLEWIDSRADADKNPHRYTKIIKNLSVRVEKGK